MVKLPDIELPGPPPSPRRPAWLWAAPALLPGLSVALLAPADGGFFPDATAIAAIGALALVVVLVLARRAPFGGISVGLLVASSALLGFAGWTLLSAFWSDAPGRALLETDRVVLYAAVLIAFGLLGRTLARTRLLMGALAVACIGLCVGGVLVWLLPETFPLGPAFDLRRLGWPTTYWNATGLIAALGLTLALRLTTATGEPAAVRAAGAASLVPASAALVFCVSRGGALSALVGVAVVLLAGRCAGTLPGLLAGVPAVAGAVAIALSVDGLGAEPPLPEDLVAARDTAIALALVAIAAAAVRLALVPLDARLVRWAPSPVARRRVAVTALALLTAGVTSAFLAGAADRVRDAADQLTSEAAVPLEQPASERFTRLENNGRLGHWEVAIDAGFTPAPVHGAGAGTYAKLWLRDRDVPFDVLDAHSLWVEVLAELGIVGVLLLGTATFATALALVRRAREDRAGPWPGLLAAASAWVVHASIDWHWESAGLTAWVFAAGGLALAAPVGAGPVRATRLPVRALVAAACIGLAVLPASILRSQDRLQEAVAALRVGDCPSATVAALSARDALGARAEPYEILAYCEGAAGRLRSALGLVRSAQRRDPANWELHYAEAMVRAANGGDPRPALRVARRYNPLGELAVTAQSAAGDDATAWRRFARTAPLPLPATRACGRPCDAAPAPR